MRRYSYFLSRVCLGICANTVTIKVKTKSKASDKSVRPTRALQSLRHLSVTDEEGKSSKQFQRWREECPPCTSIKQGHQPRWGQRAQRTSRFLLRQRRGFDLRRRTVRQESRRHQVSRYFSSVA